MGMPLFWRSAMVKAWLGISALFLMSACIHTTYERELDTAKVGKMSLDYSDRLEVLTKDGYKFSTSMRGEATFSETQVCATFSQDYQQLQQGNVAEWANVDRSRAGAPRVTADCIAKDNIQEMKFNGSRVNITGTAGCILTLPLCVTVGGGAGMG